MKSLYVPPLPAQNDAYEDKPLAELIFGGDKLANQAVEAIRQAEQKAQELEQQASIKAAEIIHSAKERASALAEENADQAQKEALAQVETAHRQEEAVMRQSLQQAEQEISALRLLVKEREPQAVQTVLTELI